MEVWAHKTSLTWHFFFIEVPISRQEREQCVGGIHLDSFYYFLFDFGTFFSILLLPEILIQYSYSI
jgi:hypothetical protein